MRACVGANLTLIAACGTWLLLNWRAAEVSPWTVIAALLVGYFLADVASGLVHWATDTWFDERVFFGRRIAIAREHHTHPKNILGYSFLEHATVGSTPSALFIGPFAVITALSPTSGFTFGLMIVFLVISVCLLFGTSLHNLGHRRCSSVLLRWAQRFRLVMSPEHHSAHHCGDHTIRYCTVNGWADYPLDRLDVWRWLERRIERVTGAVPRRDDVAWRTRNSPASDH